MTRMPLPNFILIGAAKSGTTALYRSLEQHPEIYMSPKKEPNYFGLGFGRPRYHEPVSDSRRRWREPIDTLDAYLGLFRDVGAEKAIGEGSPGYLYDPCVPDRIEALIPNVKVIAILRNPVDRAFSSFMHAVRDAKEPIPDFARALAAEDQRVRENWHPFWHYRRRGLYYHQLKRYFERFGEGRVGVFLYDDLVRDSVGLSQAVFRFLGVGSTFVPHANVRFNASGLPRSQILQAFLTRPSPVRRALRRVLPVSLRSPAQARLQHLNLRRAPPMKAEVRMELTRYYREDVRRLEDLIGRDLSGWTTFPASGGI